MQRVQTAFFLKKHRSYNHMPFSFFLWYNFLFCFLLVGLYVGFSNLELQKLATNSKEEPDKVKTEELFSNSKPEEEPDKFNTEGLFCKGTLVEVSSDEDGFQGAWFAATTVEPTGKDKYLVEYQSLRTEDDKEFLKEEIDIKHIRPSPPETLMVDRFNKLDEVDALYNDGWWVGVISKVCSNSKYVVYFKTTKEELTFEHSDLRLHQDWINGKWVTASQV